MPTILTGDRPTGRLHLGGLCNRIARQLCFLLSFCFLTSPVLAARIVEASRAGNVALVYFPPPHSSATPQRPQIWSLSPWRQKCVVRGNFKNWVREENSNGAVAFSDDGRLVAFGFDDSTIEIYRTDTGKLWERLGRKQAAPSSEADGYYRVDALAFAPGHKTLASSNIKGVFFWDLRTRKLHFSRPITARVKNLIAEADGRFLSPVRPAEPADLCFSPNGKTLAIAGSQRFPVFLFDVVGRRVRHVLPLDAQEGSANTIAFSPDGKRVLCVGVWAASGGSYDKIDLFDARNGRALWHWSDVESYKRNAFIANSYDQVAFSADGRRFAVSNDKVLEIRSTKMGRLLARRELDSAKTLAEQKRLLPALAVR